MKHTITPGVIFKFLLLGTGFSMLVFFSCSFLSFIFDLSTFNHHVQGDSFHFDIGFPFIYYSEFYLDGNRFPSTSWNPFYLFLDCLLTWLFVVLPYMIIKLRAKNSKMRKNEMEKNVIDQ